MATKRELSEAIALLRAEFQDMPTFDKIRLDMWWRALEHFPDGAIQRAAESHITTSKFKPQLADIVQACAAQLDGSWLNADEAWALMPKSEGESAMLTNEIAEAMAAASPLLESGDKNAARMAFRAAYERLVGKAKIEGRQPKFFPSFGTDAATRVTMLASAVQKGQMTLEHATEALPEYAPDLVRMLGVKNHPLLAGPSDATRAKLREVLATLRLGNG